MSKTQEEEYTEAETEQRMKEALKRALNTPPTPHKPKSEKEATPKRRPEP